MQKNWKTNIGGAISVMGTSLLGIGLLTQLAPLLPNSQDAIPPEILRACWWLAFVGFILSAVGKGLASFFAADASTLSNLTKAVQQHADAINSIPDAPIKAQSPGDKPVDKPPTPGV